LPTKGLITRKLSEKMSLQLLKRESADLVSCF